MNTLSRSDLGHIEQTQEGLPYSSQLGPVFLEQTNSRNYQVNFYEDDISTQQR